MWGACSDWAGEIVFFSKIRTQFRSIIECVITLQPRMWDSLEILRLTEVKKGKVQLNFRFSIKRTKSTGISCDICERFHMRTPWKAIAFQNIWPPCLAFVLKCAALAAVITRYAFALKSNKMVSSRGLNMRITTRLISLEWCLSEFTHWT